MIKYFILAASLLISTANVTAAQSDSLVTYEIKGDAHAFMCPFLTPKFMDAIKEMCDCTVSKSPDLVIHVQSRQPDAFNKEKLLLKAEEIGYEPKNIHIQKLTQ